MRNVAEFLRVLGDEIRLQILWLLLNRREMCVCDIMDALGISQSKASRHLATLRHAGLVVDRKEGAWSYYAVCPPETDFGRAVFAAVRTKLAGHPDAARAVRDLRVWIGRKARSTA